MARIFALAWKDALVRFAYRSELLFFIVLPVVFTVLLAGIAVPGGGSDSLSLYVSDADGSNLSAGLITVLVGNPALDVQVLGEDAARAAFASGVGALLLIPSGFEDTLLAGQPLTLDLQTQPDDLNGLLQAQAVEQAATAVLRPLQAAHLAAQQQELATPFTSQDARQAYFQQALEAARELETMDTEPRLLVGFPAGAAADDDADRPQQQAAGQMVGWVLIPLLSIATYLAYERQRGTLRRLAATPTSSSAYFLGTIGGQVTTAGLQILLLLGFGSLVMGLDWGDSPAGLAVLLLVFCLCGAALGTMLGAFVRSPGQARSLAIIAGMAMSLLGGAWVPIEVFPPAVRTAVHILPTTWAMQGLLDIIIRGQGLRDVLPETAVLLVFAALFFFVGVRWFRFD